MRIWNKYYVLAHVFCFTFQVNQDYLRCEDFLIGDITVGSYRYFLFATEKQLSLLRAAKRWYMDGTFKVSILQHILACSSLKVL